MEFAELSRFYSVQSQNICCRAMTEKRRGGIFRQDHFTKYNETQNNRDVPLIEVNTEIQRLDKSVNFAGTKVCVSLLKGGVPK